MAVIKILKEDGTWEYISVDGSNADTIDGKHADEFMPRILDSSLYGTSLPSAGTAGRIFFVKKS